MLAKENTREECLSISIMLEGGNCLSLQKSQVSAENMAEFEAIAASAIKLAAKIK